MRSIVDKRTWIRKAQALLLPSVFAEVDPDGERERQAQLRKYLQDSLGEDIPENITQAQQESALDAYDAQTHFHKESTDRTARTVPIKHPLSATSLPGYVRTSPQQVQVDFQRFLDSLPSTKRDGKSIDCFYRDLWYAANRPDSGLDLLRLAGSVRMPDHSVLAHRSLTAALHGARTDGPAALLYVHVGPVQSFIAAARRTHDLWVGSFTVAYLTYIAVEQVAKCVGPDALVFPDLAYLPLSQQRLFSDNKKPESLTHASLSNKLLAIVPHQHAEAIAREAVCAAQTEWKAMAKAAKAALERAYPKFSSSCDKWQEQVDAHLEIDVVIQPWPQDRERLHKLISDIGLIPPEGPLSAQGHPDQQSQLVGDFYGRLFDLSHRTMAAHRKTVFPQFVPGDSRPKCIQCVRREQMGPIASPGQERQQHRLSGTFFTELSQALQKAQGLDNDDDRLSLQLGSGEGLCAVCLVKRLAPKVYYGNREQSKLPIHWNDQNHRRYLRFPSVSSIASAPLCFVLGSVAQGKWDVPNTTKPIREAIDKAIVDWRRSLDALCQKDALDFTHPGNLLAAFRDWEKDDTMGRLLAVDGSWLYPEFYVFDTVWRTHYPSGSSSTDGEDASRRERVRQKLPPAGKCLEKVLKPIGCNPSTYLAVLCMDVDMMGDWLTGKAAPKWREIVDGVQLDPRLGEQKRPLYPALGADLSRRLGQLATQTFLLIVEKECLGRVVYGGGDDLLALLPLQTALVCMDRLNEVIRGEEHLGSTVTLSMGLHIMHWRDPLTRAINSARDAEKKAKGRGRNRFVISLNKRSGSRMLLDLPWQLAAEKDGKRTKSLSAIHSVLSLVKACFREQNEGAQNQAEPRESDDEAQSQSARAAYELEQEILPLLKDAQTTLLDGLFDRTRALCRYPRNQPWIGEAFLWAKETKHGEENSKRETPDEENRRRQANLRRFVDVLLLVRFLQREEHGIDTDRLLRKLDEKRQS